MPAASSHLATQGLTALAILFAAVFLTCSWWQSWIQAPRNYMQVKEWKASVREVIWKSRAQTPVFRREYARE